MTTIRVSHNKNYTVIHNETLRDRRLSYKARGIHHELLSYPDDWEVNVKQLVIDSDRRDSVISGLKELEELGYLVKQTTRNKRGQFVTEYVIYEFPHNRYGLSDTVEPERVSRNGSTVTGLSGNGSPGYGKSGCLLSNVERSNISPSNVSLSTPPLTPQSNFEEGEGSFSEDDFFALPESLAPKSPDPSPEHSQTPSTNQNTSSKTSVAPSRSGYEYGNKAQQADHLFGGKRFPWTGDDRFIEWLADNWPWSGEGDNRELKIASRRDWLRKRERFWDVESIEDRWKVYQSASGNTNAPQDALSAIGKELRRLNMSSEIPADWRRRTGKTLVTELSAKDAGEYLAYLRSLEGVA